MATQATFVLNDGEATPVAHTFVPDGVQSNGVRAWREFNAANPVATKYFTLFGSNSAAKPGEAQIPGREVPARKSIAKTTWPITYVDSVSGLTLLDHVLIMKTELACSPRATAQQCKNVRTVHGNAVAGSTFLKFWDENEKFSG